MYLLHSDPLILSFAGLLLLVLTVSLSLIKINIFTQALENASVERCCSPARRLSKLCLPISPWKDGTMWPRLSHSML